MLPTIVRRNSWPGLIDEIFNDGLFPKTSGKWIDNYSAPAVNVSENDKEYKIEVAAPGLDKGDFRINVENEILTISSEKKEEKEEKKDNYLRREFGYCTFKRSFELPETVDADKIKAAHKNGVLNVILPKKEETVTKVSKDIKIS